MRGNISYDDPPETPEDPSVLIVEQLLEEVERAQKAGNGVDDLVSTENDWISYVLAYLGRASRKVYRNQRDIQEYRENMIKAGGLIISAIRAYDIKASADPAAPEDPY